jgi:phosphoglucosamine mutase
MKARGAVLGGEASGHMIFLDHHTTGDGIISALQLLAAKCAAQKPLSELAKIMTLAPQQMINLTVKQKPPLESLPELQKAVRAADAELGDNGRVLIRYSGTQAMCRVMVEGPTVEMTNRLTHTLADVVKKCIA